MGVQILNKDVSLLASVNGKAKATISNVFGATGWAGGGGGGTFAPGDFNFNDVTFSPFSEGYSDTITFTKSGTLYITCVQGSNGNIGAVCYVNGPTNYLDFWVTTTEAALNVSSLNTGGSGITMYNALYAAINVNVNNTMYFYFYNEGGGPFNDLNASINFKTTSFTGTLIDSFTINMA
jgi:hypothetical protein